MSPKMTVLTFAATGHVLGAVTRTGQPETAPQPADIVGDALLVRDPETGQLEIHVAAERLSAVLVDRADHVLLNFRAFTVEGGLVEEQPELPSGFTLTLNGVSVGVDLGAGSPVFEDTDVWVQIEGDAILNPIVRTFQIPENDHQVSEALSLPVGDYTILVLIPGFRAAIQERSIP
jgi:hypothetical protein